MGKNKIKLKNEKIQDNLKNIDDEFKSYYNTKNNQQIYNLENDELYRDIVLLYCPAKVGSTTIASSIRTWASNKFIVIHSHNENILNVASENGMMSVNYNDIINNNKILNKEGKPRKIYIIDIYRTMIERKISEFFQHLASFHFNNTEENLLNYPIEKIIRRFNSIFEQTENIDYFIEKFGLSNKVINENNFDFEKKYIKIESNNVTWIKLRLKDSMYWEEILTNLLGVPIKIINDYNTQNKIIGPLYKKFISQYKLPINFYNIISSCNQMKKYYTQEEQMEYLNIWNNNLCDYFQGLNLDQYKLYVGLSNDNRYYKEKDNEHYRDDGCVCFKCKKKRILLINNINKNLTNVNVDLKIKHTYDYDYNNAILLRLYNKKIKLNNSIESMELTESNENNEYIDRVINYFNFY